MKKVYRVLAYLVGVAIIVQAASVVWAVSGLSHWIDGGGVADKALVESQSGAFPEELGFMIHGLNGSFGVPVLSLLLVIASFFVHARGAVKWAVIVFVLTVLQSQLGYLSHDYPISGAVHGLNALVLFTCVVITARRPLKPMSAPVESPVTEDAVQGS